jgi:4-amino-4-deoxy-L-arabinose transferase-like glycosyltransferase
VTRRHCLIVFALALGVRLAYLAWAYEGPDSLRSPDSAGYETAAAWLAGEVAEGQRPVELLARRTPGYPLYLAGFRTLLGPHPLWPVLGQSVLDALTCVLIGWLAGLMNRRLALPAGLLAALNLNLITASGVVLTETVFLLFFVASLVAAVRYLQEPGGLSAGAAGALLGLAMLVRPVLQYFPPVLLVAFALGGARRLPWPRLAAHLGLAVLCLLLTIGPRLAQNLERHGEAALSSIAGHALLDYQVPLAWGWATGRPWQELHGELQRRLEEYLAGQGLDALPDDPFEASRHQRAVALAALPEIGVLSVARAWLTVAAINLFSPAVIALPNVRALERPHLDDTRGDGPLGRIAAFAANTAHSAYFRWLLAGGLGLLLVRGVQLVGLMRIGRPGGLPRAPSLYLLAAAAYFVAVTGAFANVRLRLPLEPLLSVLLAAGLVWLGDQRRARSRT